MIEDEKIIEMFFGRSEQGIRELDIKYGKVCHKLSYNIVNSRQDAEECVNDAYLGAWNAIPPAKPNPLLAYICKIVRNISLKIYYRKEAAKRSSTYTIAMEEIEACIADPNTVEAEIEARELARIIESFLDTLTVENRVIFMRRYWFSDSYKDIAEFMGLSEKNISVRLTRIREKMKQYSAWPGPSGSRCRTSPWRKQTPHRIPETAPSYLRSPEWSGLFYPACKLLPGEPCPCGSRQGAFETRACRCSFPNSPCP